MEFDLGNISIMYPNENNPTDRQLKIRTDGEILHIDFIDPNLNTCSLVLDKKEARLLSGTLKLILNNKLIE